MARRPSSGCAPYEAAGTLNPIGTFTSPGNYSATTSFTTPTTNWRTNVRPREILFRQESRSHSIWVATGPFEKGVTVDSSMAGGRRQVGPVALGCDLFGCTRVELPGARFVVPHV